MKKGPSGLIASLARCRLASAQGRCNGFEQLAPAPCHWIIWKERRKNGLGEGFGVREVISTTTASLLLLMCHHSLQTARFVTALTEELKRDGVIEVQLPRPEDLRDSLELVLPAVLRLLHDPILQARHAALDLLPWLCQRGHAEVIRALCSLSCTEQVPQLQCEAVKLLGMLAEPEDPECLAVLDQLQGRPGSQDLARVCLEARSKLQSKDAQSWDGGLT